MGVEANIAIALHKHLNTIGLSPALDIVERNTPYKPSVATAYLEADILPAQAIQASLGDTGYNRQSGIYQVTVCYPVGQGDVPAITIADAIIAHFKRGTSLTESGLTVRVSGPPYRTPAVIDTIAVGETRGAPYFRVPVSIPWISDNANPA